MMGAGMVPPPAPTPPSQLSFKSDPTQRMQFKSFMQGLSAPRQVPMAPQMMPMPQIPSPMQNIDVFSQPVQFMAQGGRASRPQDRAARAEEGRALAKRIFSRPEKDDDKEDRARRTVKITPQQEAAARAALVDAAKTRAGSEDPSDYGQFVASARNRYRRPSSLSEQVAALSSVPADFGAEFGDDRRRRELFSTGIGATPVDRSRLGSDLGARLDSQGIGFEDDIPSERSMLGIDPRQSGLGSTLSQQISALRGDELPTASEIQGIGFEDVPDDETFLPIMETPQDVNLLADSFLTRLPFGIGEYFSEGQMDQLGTFMNIPGSQYDYELGKGVAPAGPGTLTLSPSGVVTYTGRRDPNYTGPFANLVNPQTRPEREVNPCPPGYTLINGACMPISQPIEQATPATPAPNVIQNVPVTAPAPSPVVQSTAPPAQLGMPLGQRSAIQPMNQFLTNVPNSLNLAANNFLSALSS
jgi:hypothetical protein